MIREGLPGLPSFLPLMFKEFLPAELRIIELKGLAVHSKAAMISIDKITLKGLRFSSDLLFPVSPEIIIHFRMYILKDWIDLKGTIHWASRDDDLNLYEVIFLENEPAKLISPFNKLMRQYMPDHLRAEYYNKYYPDFPSPFNDSQNRVNLLT